MSKSRRYWMVNVETKWYPRQKYAPASFDTLDSALGFIEFCREYDRSINRKRKIKLMSYTVEG